MEGKGGLRKRIAIAVILGMSIILLSFGIVSYYIIQKNIEDSLNKKLTLGRLVRNNIDNIIKDNVNRLYDISLSGKVNLHDRDLKSEKEALSEAYRYSIFTDGTFLLDWSGDVKLTYPEKLKDRRLTLLSLESARRTLSTGRPVVSNIYATDIAKRKALFIMVPLKDTNGKYIGIAVGELDPTNAVFSSMLKLPDMQESAFIDIVDSNGMVIASSKPSRILRETGYHKFLSAALKEKKEQMITYRNIDPSDTNKTSVIAFVPLEMAPWGIVIKEPEQNVFGPAEQLKKTFFALGIIFVVTAFVLAVGISRSIVDPIKELIRAANQIANGELSKPTPPYGTDEIGALSHSFDTMRMKLAESLEKLKSHSADLEQRVLERTGQIREAQQKVEIMLKRVIDSEEEERKRVARELHDDILQDISVFLMRLDICKMHPEQITTAKIDDMRRHVEKTIDSIHDIIRNLRPSILDDLGLEAAIKWLLDKHLSERGIHYFLNIESVMDRRFDPQTEITLFRIVQESIVNIARHAGAGNVFVILKADDSSITADVEDDGAGFDVRSMLKYTTEDGRGLGLLGMKERASLLDGSLQICSSPGSGTRISVRLPLKHAG